MYIMRIKERIAEGTFDFSAFLDVMANKGYITEYDMPEACSLSSSGMERCSEIQEDFDLLYREIFPDSVHDISFSCIATEEGHNDGYMYILFNSNVMSL